MKIPQKLGERLVLTREALNVSRQELMRRTKISTTALSNYETGRIGKGSKRPTIPSPQKEGASICRALGINMEWLYTGEMGQLRHDVARRITEYLEAGWKAPLPHQKKGRPKKRPRAHAIADGAVVLKFPRVND
jgi:transcriptional regulator with XRE-family HTH domain